MSKLKNPFNDKGQYHGYQEWYDNGKLWLRGVFKKSQQIGYVEYHIYIETNYYIR